MMLDQYLPTKVNAGPWVTAYTLAQLQNDSSREFVLPICSLDTPYADLVALGQCLLPPLYHQAMDDDLKQQIIERIQYCFPIHGDPSGNKMRLRVVEIPAHELAPARPGALLAFSVDTAVEEHGPHLPLATDTIQSYSVLAKLAQLYQTVEVCRPVEYGQLTWGLPFGFSVDLTAELLTIYVRGYVNALVEWKQPAAIYVVDVHGSIVHRGAIVAGLESSRFDQWAFRWLHEPLAEFASARGDQHAGGVETALVNRVSNELLDPAWWPHRIDEIAAAQMSFEKAVELTNDLDGFSQYADEHSLNGVIGDINNFPSLDAEEMFARMLSVASTDVEQLIAGSSTSKAAGQQLW